MTTVLLTGATGAIGSAVGQLLLDEPDTGVHLLLRARSDDHLQERLRHLGDFWGVDPGAAPVARRLVAHRGDVSQPRLGLDPAAYRQLAGQVTHVIHCAGNVRLNQSLGDARRDAVDAARAVIEFAREGRRGGPLQKLEFVSTVGVAGRLPGLVPERPLREPRVFRNTYEAAKAEAEDLVVEEMARGLPATIHRPSMVVGDSTTGRIIRFQVFYYLSEFLSGRRTLGIVPDAGDVRLDIVPVDYVARAIGTAACSPESAGRVLHLCSGPDHAPRITDLAHALHEHFGALGARVPPLRMVSPRLIRMALPLVARVAPPRTRRALRSLPFFLAYLDGSQLFDDARTREFLAPKGVVLPPVARYLDTILRCYWLSRTASQEPPAAPVSRPHGAAIQ